MLPYLVEFIGTFIFLSVILNATAKNSSMAAVAPIAIGIALVAAIQFGGAVSGGHFNPAVSAMFFMKGDLPSGEVLPYVAAQVAGGYAALMMFNASRVPRA
jgi:glycerol uptake facilitator-like aquaporin